MSSDITVVIQRLVDLSSDIPGIESARDGDQTGNIDPATQLPMIVVEEGDAVFPPGGVREGNYIEAREYFLKLLFRTAKTGEVDLDRAGRQAIRPLQHTIAGFFMTKSRLQRGTDSGLNGVQSARPTNDQRAGITDHGGNAYWGAYTTIRVEVRHTSSG